MRDPNRPRFSRMARVALILCLPAMAATQAMAQAGTQAGAQAATPRFTAADIEAARFDGTAMPAGKSALGARLQVLLDRAGISPGVTDGFNGGMSRSAIETFERRAGLRVDGVLDLQVWDLLGAYAVAPITRSYTITPADAQGLVPNIPSDYAQKAQMSTQGYTSIAEKLAERFHMDEKFLTYLNPGIPILPGETITVTDPGPERRGTVARVSVDKDRRRVTGYDANGQILVDYPATIGSTDTPSPSGSYKVRAIALDPVYTYNPSRNFKQGDNDKVLSIPPGPNGPVGDVWIALTKPTYGIHGTATPARLFVSQSHGCVRLTNWDARELAHMVQPGVTTVDFLPLADAPADAAADAGAAPSRLSLRENGPVSALSSARRPVPAPRLRPAQGTDAVGAAALDGTAAPVPSASQPAPR
ncbi:L,D-transpeptidase family protein [Paracoccus jiaweipingae]|uniref:L,D-transpeptidase family protein n=1 Tax=unclassified Paracoccus (in: a-proteobacteria) TaxID=2688777 RepID=UPI0037872EF5